MLLFYATVDFFKFYDGAAEMQIWALLIESQCRVSDTQVTFKALGPLVSRRNMKCTICNSGELYTILVYSSLVVDDTFKCFYKIFTHTGITDIFLKC